jgi:C4-dicarboxylate-specific signal transduction histidine kinase
MHMASAQPRSHLPALWHARTQEATAAAVAEHQAASEKATYAITSAIKARSEAEARVQALQRDLDGLSTKLLQLGGSGPGPQHPASGG